LQAIGASVYQWYNNNVGLPGATDSNYIPLQNGTYFVIGTSAQGCKDTSNNILVTANLQALVNGSTRLFPNPAKNQFVIQLADEETNEGILEIADIAGKLIFKGRILFSEKESIFNLAPFNLSPSLYQIRLTTKTESMIFRLRKE